MSFTKLSNALILAVLLLSSSAMAQFTPGRLAVLRVGSGAASLTSASTALFIDEYTTAGVAGFTLSIPSVAGDTLTSSGSASSEGLITLSSDRTMIVVPGYNRAAGVASIASSTAAVTNRGIGVANGAGTWSVVTTTNTNYSANNLRSATSDGTNYWATGAATGICTGTGTAGSGLNTIVSSTVVNNRGLAIYAGQLFFSTGSGSSRGIYMLGTGTPVSASNTSMLYIATGTTSSSYQFSFNSDTSICYIADDNALASRGGIRKYTRSGSTWTLTDSSTTGTGSTLGVRGLTVDWSGVNPVIYATTTESSANRIISVTDIGSNLYGQTVTVLATAATNTVFRGICWTPGSGNPLPVRLVSFNAKKANGYTQLTWATASESNNSHFVVEKQVNAVWESIGTVKGSGNTSAVKTYTFKDVQTNASCVYYRLKQVDFNGQFSYSTVVDVCGNAINRNIQVMPNPFESSIQIQLESVDDEVINCELYDAKGSAYSLQLEKDGPGQYHISGLDHPTGIYMLRIETKQGSFVKRITR